MSESTANPIQVDAFAPKITAAEVLDLLRVKHSKDVFVPECKDGPTQSVTNHLRMDAWVMPRSWSRPGVTAYEIKVDRQDFLRDDKWPKYLELCNALYFVAPRGVIDASEIAPEVGLLEVSKNAKKLYTRKKAPLRSDVEIPESVFRYVLMCRATISESERRKEDRFEYWESWLRTRKRGAELGYQVSERIRQVVDRVQSENRALRKQNEQLAETRELLAEMGIDLDAWNLRRAAEDRLKEVHSGASRDLRRQLEWTAKSIGDLVQKIEGEYPG